MESNRSKRKMEDEVKLTSTTKTNPLENVVASLDRAESRIRDVESEASRLLEMIRLRGEGVKAIVDSIVEDWSRVVETELRLHVGEAAEVVDELKRRETILTAEVNDLRTNSDCYHGDQDPMEFLADSPEASKDVPKYSRRFDVSLTHDNSDQRSALEKILGKFRTGLQMKQVEENQLAHDVQSFAIDGDDVYLCYRHESCVDVFGADGTELRRSIDLREILTNVIDLQVISNVLYVVGNHYEDDHDRQNVSVKVLKVSPGDQIMEVLIIKVKGSIFRLLKSYRGDVLFIYDKSLMQISDFTQKEIDLPFKVFDALPLEKKRHVVCSNDGRLCVIDFDGNVVVEYSSSVYDSSAWIQAPCCLARDRWGRIYVGDHKRRKIFVLDEALNFVCSFDISCCLFKLVYNKAKDSLVALASDRKLLVFEL